MKRDAEVAGIMAKLALLEAQVIPGELKLSEALTQAAIVGLNVASESIRGSAGTIDPGVA